MKIITPDPASSSSSPSRFVRCCYVNSTSQIQIGRISNVESWHFEKIFYPGLPLFFEAPPAGRLEIYTGDSITAVLCDRIEMSTTAS